MRSGSFFFLLYFLLFGILVTGEVLHEISFTGAEVESSGSSSAVVQKGAGCFFLAVSEVSDTGHKINNDKSSGKYSQRLILRLENN